MASRPGQVSEREFQRMVVELATALGYRHYHTWNSIHSNVGWPDLVLWKPGRFICAELKSQGGKLTAAQREVLSSLKEAGVESYVWRPQDWDTIVDVLKGGQPSDH